MGRAMLIITTLVLVVYGIIQVSNWERREQITDTNVEAYQNVEANNLAMSGLDFAMRKLKNNKDWRGPTTKNILGQDVTFEAEDYTTNTSLNYGHLLVRVYTQASDKVDTLNAKIRRGGVIPPVYSALGFYSDSLGFDAEGKSFEIDGNDENIDGTSGPGSSLHGIKTTTQNAYDTVYNALKNVSPDQTGNVIGKGSTPSMSVDSTMSPGNLDTLVSRYLNNADYTYTDGSYGSQTLGTDSDPKITVIDQNSDVEMSGSGSGVLLVRQGANFKLTGDFTYHGILLNRGQVGQSTGSVAFYGATIFGSNVTSYQSIELDGNIKIQYSTQALSIVEEAFSQSIDYEYKILSLYE